MAAPKGNQFWKLRSKHGRDKLFASPELLWEAACEYFEWCEKNPLIEIDFKGKDADRVELPKMRAFTLQGLCLYLGCNTDYFKNFRNQERAGIEDFSPVIAMIEDTIYNQKFTGAAAGFLNANIISRDLGLLDRKELEHKGIPDYKVTYVMPPDSDDD
jgi:hypothetical protein